MKFLISTLLIALLSFLCGLYLPWWGFALAACLIGALLPQKPGLSFLAGFLALFILWGGLACFIDAANNSILSAKIAQILPLDGSPFLLILVTGFVAALVGGGSALTGCYLTRKAPVRETEEDFSLSYPEEEQAG
jgi:hypothetical protein